MDVHTSTKPEICIIPNSIFEIQKRFGCNLCSEWIITVKSEVRILIDADQKRTKISGNTIDQLGIIEMKRSEEK